MFGFNRDRRPISADFIAPVREPSGAELTAWQPQARQYSAGEVVTLIDGHLRQQSARPAEARNTELIDVLLGLRNVLTVPVIPGRTS